MSSKRSNKKRYKTSEESANERQQSSRRSNRFNPLDFDNHINPNSTSSPINSSPKVAQNLSQYFPSRKNSPRSQLKSNLKYTRIKSPKNQLIQRAFCDEENPITYGENDIEEELSQPSNRIKALSQRNDNKSDRSVKVDFKQLLSSFDAYMDQAVDEEEEYSDRMEFNKTDYVPNQTFNYDNNHNSCMSSIVFNRNNDNTFNTRNAGSEKFNCESDIEYENLVLEKDKQLKNTNTSQKSFDDCEEDFDFSDDSFERIVSEMPIPMIEESSIETKRNVDLDDDGFDSDGEFDRIVCNLTEEQLLGLRKQTTPNTKSASTARTPSSSRSSTNLMTMTQIIELINSP